MSVVNRNGTDLNDAVSLSGMAPRGFEVYYDETIQAMVTSYLRGPYHVRFPNTSAKTGKFPAPRSRMQKFALGYVFPQLACAHLQIKRYFPEVIAVRQYPAEILFGQSPVFLCQGDPPQVVVSE